MVILHIASIKNDPLNGVCVAVPAHVNAQSKHADVGFMNITNEIISNVEMQIEYKKTFNISSLKKPFNKPDLVVFHECYRIDYVFIANNLKKKGIPYVIIPHGELRIEAQKKKQLKKVVANLLIFNRFINQGVAIQCLSEAELQNTKFGKNKFVGTNGVRIPSIKKGDFNKNQVKFIYIGRYEWRVKGLDILLDAVKIIEKFMRENHCTIDMYGPDILGRYADVESMILERDIGDIVTLHHEIIGHEKEEKLLEADIFIQTSRHEGMPMGILEALSYGVPCLITKGTTLGEYISDYDAGWVSKTNADSLSEMLIEAVNERKIWIEKGKKAFNLIGDNFAWDKVAQDNIKNYLKYI